MIERAGAGAGAGMARAQVWRGRRYGAGAGMARAHTDMYDAGIELNTVGREI